MRSTEEVRHVLELCARGLNDCEISRATGIPRATVAGWRRGRTPRPDTPARAREGRNPCPICARTEDGLVAPRYAYLLGLYLGDGTISSARKDVYRLRIFLDRRYPGIISECVEAMGSIFGTRVARTLTHDPRYPDGGMEEVSCYSKHWPCVFPQHGPGMKHTRRIALTSWQESVLRAHPHHLLRGMVHSDGCRVLNRVKARRYTYVRYMFSNRSEDIIGIFTRTCDELGIGWTRPRRDNVSIARHADTQRLDSFIGPKR